MRLTSRARSRLTDMLTLQRGFDLPEPRREEGSVPVLASTGIVGFHSEKRVDGPGVVIGRSGSIGGGQYIADDFWPLNTTLWVKDFKGHNARFVYYLLRTIDFTVFNAGAGVPTLNRNHLESLLVPVFDPRAEARIADILSAYDDLIENNRRRMALLEGAARELYREWFVRLRFPGCEHSRIINSVPEGWDPKALGDLCVDIRETVSPDKTEGDTPYIGLEHMPRRSISLCNWGQASEVSSGKHRFRAGEILFGKIRPYFHKVGVAFVDGVASSDAIVIRPLEEKLGGLVLMTVSSDSFVAATSQAMREGSKMPRADWKQMQEYPVLLPPHGLLREFDGAIQSIVGQLKILTFTNQKLRAARDLLLPRLMSGEIAV
jgi:type I restriction enzyme, S subunit